MEFRAGAINASNDFCVPEFSSGKLKIALGSYSKCIFLLFPARPRTVQHVGNAWERVRPGDCWHGVGGESRTSNILFSSYLSGLS